MSKKLITESILSDVANAIRNKLGISSTIKPVNFANKISEIESSEPFSITESGMSICDNAMYDASTDLCVVCDGVEYIVGHRQYIPANIKNFDLNDINPTDNSWIDDASNVEFTFTCSSCRVENQPYKAFDQDLTTAFHSNGETPSWVQMELSIPICITGFSYMPEGTSNRVYPTSWSIQGSNDGNTWTTIADFTQPSAGVLNDYRFENDTYYNRYRWNCTQATVSCYFIVFTFTNFIYTVKEDINVL